MRKAIVGIVWTVHTNLFAVVWLGEGRYRAFAQDDTPVFVVANILLFLLGALVISRMVEQMMYRLGALRALMALGSILLAAYAVSGLALATI